MLELEGRTSDCGEKVIVGEGALVDQMFRADKAQDTQRGVGEDAADSGQGGMACLNDISFCVSYQ